MSNSKVLLGAGDATGMFYTAPLETTVPASPSEATTAALEQEGWENIGAIGVDGVTPGYDRNTNKIKDWANNVARNIVSGHTESLEIPAIETSYETAVVMFGQDAVQRLEANAQHGAGFDLNLDGSMPDAAMFLLRMKDGDNRGLIYAEDATITNVAISTFKPGEAIIWTGTLEANKGGIHIVFDDGQTTAGGGDPTPGDGDPTPGEKVD